MFAWIFLSLIVTHWLADFVFQTHWQASNKSKNNEALTLHIAIYTAVMTAGFALFTLIFKVHMYNMFDWSMIAAFAGITFVTH